MTAPRPTPILDQFRASAADYRAAYRDDSERLHFVIPQWARDQVYAEVGNAINLPAAFVSKDHVDTWFALIRTTYQFVGADENPPDARPEYLLHPAGSLVSGDEAREGLGGWRGGDVVDLTPPNPAGLIGPLTAEEWCSLRAGTDDDPLQCCSITSGFRDALFYVLRQGGDRLYGRGVFRRAWRELVEHG